MSRTMFDRKWQELSGNKKLEEVEKGGICTQETLYNTCKYMAKKIREQLEGE